jgi:hypothetical protein
MKRSAKPSIIAVASFVIGVSSIGGCGADPSPESGRFSLPLVSETNAHIYRLSNASIFISGPQFLQLFSSDDPSETTLSATLQTGNYVAILFFGWTLERDDGTGNFLPVPAALVSNQAVPVSIFNGTTSTITYQFRTDGVIVTIGSGELRVNVAVEEVPPVCTPFAGDCPSGTWCPPTGLTGAPRACISEGTIGVGLPCRSPADCVANSACFDFGAGPVCAALCPSSDFDLACDSGGTCAPAGAEYGVCSPS